MHIVLKKYDFMLDCLLIQLYLLYSVERHMTGIHRDSARIMYNTHGAYGQVSSHVSHSVSLSINSLNIPKTVHFHGESSLGKMRNLSVDRTAPSLSYLKLG